MDTSYSYGNPKVPFRPSSIYVEPVLNNHDLTDYEKYLDSQKIEWATYLVFTNKCTRYILVTSEPT